MEPSIHIRLTEDQALVFFDWLVRFNERTAEPFEDKSEQRVLWDIESVLETQLTASLCPDYREKLLAARESVRDAAAQKFND